VVTTPHVVQRRVRDAVDPGMTGTTTSQRRGPADHATTAVAGRRGLSRLFRRADLLDRSSRRAGIDPFPAVLVTPRVWVALG
jgi:hypothetical protein